MQDVVLVSRAPTPSLDPRSPRNAYVPPSPRGYQTIPLEPTDIIQRTQNAPERRAAIRAVKCLAISAVVVIAIVIIAVLARRH